MGWNDSMWGQIIETATSDVQLGVVRLHEDSILPSYSRRGDAALDLYLHHVVENPEKNLLEYHTGIAIQLPLGWCALLLPRSSISNSNLYLTNSVGLIDPNYRGELILRYRHGILGGDALVQRHEPGDRVGQLLLVRRPTVNIVEVDALDMNNTDRGTDGFGSSGR